MDTTTLSGRTSSEQEGQTTADTDGGPAEPYAIAKHIGGRVRLRRTRLGLSQQELADCIGLSWQQVQKYEHGVNRLVGSRLWDISCALECPVEWFFEGLQQDGATLTVTERNTDDALPDEEAELLVNAYWAIDNSKVRSRFRALMGIISGADADTAQASRLNYYGISKGRSSRSGHFLLFLGVSGACAKKPQPAKFA